MRRTATAAKLALLTAFILASCKVQGEQQLSSTSGDRTPSETFCIEDASTRDLGDQSNERLWALYGHYAGCFGGRDREAGDAAFKELLRREDPNALINEALRIFEPETPEPAMRLLRRAASLGSARAKDILDDYARGDFP